MKGIRFLLRYLLLIVLVYNILLIIYFYIKIPLTKEIQKSTSKAKVIKKNLSSQLQKIAEHEVPMSWLPDLYNEDAVAFLNKDLYRNRQIFGQCMVDFSLSIDKVLKIEKQQVTVNDFMELRNQHANLNEKSSKMPEVYIVKIRFDNLVFRDRLKSPKQLNCSIQRFGKHLNSSEGLINYDRPIYFQMKQNFTVITEKYGYHSFICFKATKRVYSNIFAILPTDMSRLIASFNKLSLKINHKTSLVTYRECEFAKLKTTGKKMNVLIINLESISFNHFQRIFPITFKYLNEDLKNMIVYNNFNRVGDDSFSNILPLLTGLNAYENIELGIDNEFEKYLSFHDDIPFIWSEFAKLGYVTMFNEELPNLGVFKKVAKAFQPTTFYTPPFFDRYERMSTRSKLCFENEPIYNRTLNLISAFINRMTTVPNQNLPYFSFNFLKYYTNNLTTIPVEFDQKLTDTIKRFEINKLLDNTLLIVMSDKGSLFSEYSYKSEAGRKERNLPFFSMRLPRKLWGSKYHVNAQNNRFKIFNAFDVYKTLQQFKHLNYFESISSSCRQAFAKSSMVRMKRGVSLFENINFARDCTDAMIPMIFCSKISKVSYTLSNYSRFMTETGYGVEEASQIVLEKINNNSNDYRDQCELFTLEKTTAINLLFDASGFSFYELQVLVAPDNVLFEGHLIINEMNRLEVYGKVSRVSPYKNESFCIEIDVPKLQGFCSCKVLEEYSYEEE